MVKIKTNQTTLLLEVGQSKELRLKSPLCINALKEKACQIMLENNEHDELSSSVKKIMKIG